MEVSGLAESSLLLLLSAHVERVFSTFRKTKMSDLNVPVLNVCNQKIASSFT